MVKSLNINFAFSDAELRREAERRAKEEKRTLTSHINELVKQDARRHPPKKNSKRS